MSNFKKIIVSILSCLLLSISTTSMYAQENMNPVSFKDNEVEVKWWPKDPNPKPGSEAWLQQYGYVYPKDMTTARRCAMRALKNAIIPGGIEAGVNKFLAQKAFDVYSFAIAFGISFAYDYYLCCTGR